ncbi:MAG: aldolase/citrate lyase family protein [candidate division KSB1 bacterium]|nr:aldolase/citrate lyase family protein [candidate division KSB1 bacterium]MDZ7335829.1 aldolase/citrate lyase family protein [candidate division KSB1 bacterium]MDZ7356176.1 aldolase/citrate lyase family protein [candidate division KSB1 bacterium]MDZ7400319.1 aldolase/citrate lyase family protein [candidate division KSB1 bacterium]
MSLAAEVGRKGADVRSDCWFRITPTTSGGIQLQLNSKVKTMYGSAIETLIRHGLKFFQIDHAMVEFEDSGALPFTIMARLETAVRRLGLDQGRQWLPEFKAFCQYPTSRERFRRSRLYLPGNEPKFMINAGIHKPDGIILDLEDSVAPTEKDAAQTLVRNALLQIDFYGAERMVRINQLPRGLDDLGFVVPYNVHVILIPKCESAEHVKMVEQRVHSILNDRGLEQQVYYMPIIESALGAIRAFEIATASPDIVALTIGLEDYTADIGTQRTLEGRESFWARSQVVNAARAAGIQPIDTVFSDVTDMEGLRQSVLEAKSLGFDGKGCIHPRQIQVIHEAFAPTPEEIERATKIVLAFESAQKSGLGVVALGSKMIDPPVVKRAQRTIRLAIETGKLAENWRQGGEQHG